MCACKQAAVSRSRARLAADSSKQSNNSALVRRVVFLLRAAAAGALAQAPEVCDVGEAGGGGGRRVRRAVGGGRRRQNQLGGVQVANGQRDSKVTVLGHACRPGNAARVVSAS